VFDKLETCETATCDNYFFSEHYVGSSYDILIEKLLKKIRPNQESPIRFQINPDQNSSKYMKREETAT